MSDHQGASEFLDVVTCPPVPPHCSADSDGCIGNTAAENDVLLFVSNNSEGKSSFLVSYSPASECRGDTGATEIALGANGIVAPLLDVLVCRKVREGFT